MYTFLEDFPNWGDIRIEIRRIETGSKVKSTKLSLKRRRVIEKTLEQQYGGFSLIRDLSFVYKYLVPLIYFYWVCS